MSFKFDINIKLTIFTLVFMPILINLGLWQLSRAVEKVNIESRWQQKRQQPALNFTQVKGVDKGEATYSLEYQNVKFSGRYITDQYWLVESKIVNKQLGYDVLVPFVITDENVEAVIVVNRGWVKGDVDRRINPIVDMPTSQNINIVGHLKKPSDSVLIQESLQQSIPWPKRIIEIDPLVMKQQLGREIFPYILRLDVEDPTALYVDWQPINMKPEKHRAYAFQWFAMAFALIILWLFSNTNIAQMFSANSKK